MDRRRPRRGPWDRYPMEAWKYAQGMRLVLEDAREEGRLSARAGMPRRPLGVEEHFEEAWYLGFDEAEAHRARA